MSHSVDVKLCVDSAVKLLGTFSDIPDISVISSLICKHVGNHQLAYVTFIDNEGDKVRLLDQTDLAYSFDQAIRRGDDVVVLTGVEVSDPYLLHASMMKQQDLTQEIFLDLERMNDNLKKNLFLLSHENALLSQQVREMEKMMLSLSRGMKEMTEFLEKEKKEIKDMKDTLEKEKQVNIHIRKEHQKIASSMGRLATKKEVEDLEKKMLLPSQKKIIEFVPGQQWMSA